MVSLEDDARSYLSRVLDGLDMSTVPYEKVQACVDQSYDGGWAAFEADFHRVMALDAPKPVELTPFQKWAKLSRMMPWEPRTTWILRPHQEVLSVTVTDDEVKAVIKIARTDEKSQRDVVTYGKRLIVWTRIDEERWSKESIEVWPEDDTEEIVRWGRVRTPDYVASQREQYETCYRPGTHKSPLQGPAARLGVSREEFHNLSKGQ